MASGMDAAVQNASQALDTSGITKSSAEGLQLGMSLAQRQQEIEKNRQQMEFQRQQMETQKHDWVHDSLKTALAEDDPKLRSVLLDGIDSQFPKLFDGKRIDPATMELMRKSPSFMEKMQAAVRVRGAMRSGNFGQLSDFDQEIMNGMTSSDMGTKLGHLNTIASQEAQIIKGLTQARIATPEAAERAGMSTEDLQKKLTDSNPLEVRKASAQDKIINEIGKVKEIQSTRAAQFQVNKAIEILNKPDPKWIDFAEANLDLAGLMQQGSAVIPEGRRKDVDFEPGAKIMNRWMGSVTGHETGGPSQKELAIVRDRLERLSRITNEVHDRSLMRELQTRGKALRQLGADPAEIYKNQRLMKQSQFSDTPTAEFTGAPTAQAPEAPPKTSQAEAQIFEQTAKERLRQAREAQKAGMPIQFTEQQVKETYKNQTGKDLE